MHNMIRKIFLASLPVVLLIKVGSAQLPAHFEPPTPESQEYEKYINYPVDHSTGAASIEVPLYTLNAGSIKIPVSLSYHTSGVKPGDPSIPVGLGWTINPGARVTRKVLNYPDEMHPKPPHKETINSIDDRLFLENMEYSDPPYPTSNRNTTYDPDYDIFTYYTGTGITGRFIIKKQDSDYVAVPLLLTKDKIKIHTDISSSGDFDQIDYIEITDANGTLYRFGQGLTSYSTAGPGNPTTENTLSGFNSTGWMLTDIISADKTDTVSLKWKNIHNLPTQYYQQTGIYDHVIVTDHMQNWPAFMAFNTENQQAEGWYPMPFYPGGQTTENSYLMTAIAGLRYKNIEVKFNYTDNNLPNTFLDSMEIYSSGAKFRQVDFHKSLFPNTSYYRLDSVSIHDPNSQVVSRYRFGYNLSHTLPDGQTRQIDFWGYYNGATSNTTLVPDFPYTIETGSVPGGGQNYTESLTTTNRQPSSNFSKTFILDTITYPTGGITTYEYDLNQIYDQANQQAIPEGGLRVTKISNWAADGQMAESRTFAYGINECGYGDGIQMTADMFVNTTMPCDYEGGGIGLTFRKREIMGSPVNSLFTYDFPPATYQQITEYVEDSQGNNSGKIVYTYTPQDYPLRRFILSMNTYSYMDRYWNRPRLLSTKVYKNYQGTFIPVQCNSSTYMALDTDTTSSWTVRRFGYITPNSGGNGPLFETNFTFIFHCCLLYLILHKLILFLVL